MANQQNVGNLRTATHDSPHVCSCVGGNHTCERIPAEESPTRERTKNKIRTPVQVRNTHLHTI